MTRYRITGQAAADLEQIGRFTQQRWGQRARIEYLERIETALQTLAANPSIGRLREELGERVSTFPVARHLIVYRRDAENRILIIRFLHPMKVLELTTDAVTTAGVPIGMSQEIVDYFKARDIRVMMSIGGITYTDAWDEALLTDAWQLGLTHPDGTEEQFAVSFDFRYLFRFEAEHLLVEDATSNAAGCSPARRHPPGVLHIPIEPGSAEERADSSAMNLRGDGMPMRTRFIPIFRRILAGVVAFAIGLGSAAASGAGSDHPRIAAEWEPAPSVVV